MLCVRFDEALDMALQDYRPNLMVDYLYDVAKAFSGFFQNCPIVKSEADVRQSRLALSVLTGRVLREGLSMLGMGVVRRM